MTAKRRNKLRKLAWEFPKLKTYGPNEGQILLVGWGSSQGPIREAVDRARGLGEAVSGLTIKHINPLPNGLEEKFLRGSVTFSSSNSTTKESMGLANLLLFFVPVIATREFAESINLTG